MPITYSIDAQKRVITEVWTGDVSAEDLANYWRRYLADPQVMAIRRTLVDLREANVLFTGKELSVLVNTVAVPRLKGKDWKSALLVERPRQYGLTRQYQVFAESYSKDAIFLDRDSAVEWLLSNGPSGADQPPTP